MHDLSLIVNNLVSAGFSELQTTTISSRYYKSKDTYCGFKRNSRYDYQLTIDTSLRKAPKEVLIGGIAHELAHILKETRMPAIISILEGWIYDLIPTYTTYDERTTDLEVIRRGYGNELLAFTSYANKRRKKYTTKDGLTKKEISKLLKQENNTLLK